MSGTSVYDAFKARLVDQLGATYPVRDFEEIEVALQQGSAPWLALEDSQGSEELTSIGVPQSNWIEDSGYLDVHIFVPSQNGLGPARPISDLVRAAFQFYHFTGLPAGETLRVNSSSPAGPGLIHDGLWHSMIMTVDYIHRYARATAAE